MISRVGVVIAGANYTGLIAALGLSHRLGDNFQIAIIDQRPGWAGGASEVSDDPRCFALSAASRHFLERVGVWPRVAGDAQDVLEIALSDTPLHAAVRPYRLRYDNRLPDGMPAASIVPGPALSHALHAAVAAQPGVTLIPDFEIAHVRPDAGFVTIEAPDGRHIRAALVIGADGRDSVVRAQANIKTTHFPHDQIGIVTTIRHSEPHNGIAIQHFLPGGPFAILPLTGNRSCITWSEDKTVAEHILSLDDAAFLDAIDLRVAGRLGALELAGSRGHFSLSTRMARAYTAQRVALVGDAAHAVHPIAGQGLNLAIRDVAALVQRLDEGLYVGLDAGDSTILEAYAQWRRFDATVSAGIFDSLNRLFSNDVALLRSLREAGLGVVDRLPGLKRQLVREAAGLSGDVPEMLRA